MLLPLLLAAAALAQGIVIEVPGAADVPLAAPTTTQPAGAVPEADAIWRAMWTDFDQSGYFRLQDPAGYLERGRGTEPGSFDMQPWLTIKSSLLVKTQAWPTGHAHCGAGQLCADAFVYYVPTGETLMKKRVRGAPSDARHLGHRIANLVLEATTGTPGAFGARLAAVNAQSGNKEIVLLDLDGEGVTPVTRNGAINLSPAWSPDGRSLAWTSYKKNNPDVFVKDLATGRTRVVSNLDGINVSPAFSSDGARMAIARASGGDSDIFEVDARTGALVRQITRGGGIDVSPFYLPDGSGLVYASERAGGSQIYRHTHGKDPQRISMVGDFNNDPVVSPDGTKLAWVTRADGGFDLFVSDIDGRGAVRITQDTGDNENPTWSPDSRYLVFSSTRTGRNELWISTADGRHQRQITRTGGWTQPTFR